MPRPKTDAQTPRKRGAQNPELKNKEEKTGQRLNSGPTHRRDLIQPKSESSTYFRACGCTASRALRREACGTKSQPVIKSAPFGGAGEKPQPLLQALAER